MTMASANMDHTDMELDTDPIVRDNQLYQQAVQDLEVSLHQLEWTGPPNSWLMIALWHCKNH